MGRPMGKRFFTGAAVFALTAAVLSGAAQADVAGATVPFTHVIVDASNPLDPHNKAMGDIDGDGFVDLLAGSSAGQGLHWYAHPTWSKNQIAAGSFTTDMQVGDIDRDGDL